MEGAMAPIATYGLLALCGMGLIAGFVVAQRAVARPWRGLALALEIGAVASAYLVLRPGRGDDPSHALAKSALDRRPLFVEVYSNY